MENQNSQKNDQEYKEGEYFLIEYTMTEEISRDAIRAYWKKTSQIIPCLLGVLGSVVLGIILNAWYFYIFTLFFLILVVLWFVKAKRAEKYQSEAMSVYYKEAPQIRITISDKVYFHSQHVDYDLDFSQFQYFTDVQSKQLLLVVNQVNKVITLPRDAFVAGDYEGCKSYLKNRIKMK